MKFRLITQKKVEKELDIKSIKIETEDGEIQILPHHENLVTLLVPSEAEIVQKDNTKELIVVNGGVLTIFQNEVTIITDEIALDSDLVESDIKKAILKAQTKNDVSVFESEDARNRTLAFLMAKLKASKKRNRK